MGKSTSVALLAAEIAELRPEWTILVEDLDPYRHLTERWPGDTLLLRLHQVLADVSRATPVWRGVWYPFDGYELR